MLIGFPGRYTAHVSPEWPAGPRKMERYYYPGAAPHGKDGVTVAVTADSGRSWMGVFAFGDLSPRGLSGVYGCSDGVSLCVVSRGAAFVVRSDAPEAWAELPCHPVLECRVVPEAGLILLADFTDLLAYGAGGIAWQTDRLYSDGFRILRCDEQAVFCTGWDARDGRKVQRVVDLRSGALREG